MTSPMPRFTPLLARPLFLILTLLAAFAALGLTARPVRAAGVIYYVTPTGSDSNPGTSWATAKQHVQSGINASNPGDQIWVEKGMYTENVTLKTSTKLYGGFAGTETMLSQRNFTTNVTTIDGNQAGTVVTAPSSASSTTVVDGFTIQNGKVTDGSGAGINCPASPTISNCIITNNSLMGDNTHSTYGAGIYINGSPTISGCSIVGNTNKNNGTVANLYGGGLYINTGTCNISNTTVTSNSAQNSDDFSGYSSYGGGIYINSATCNISNTTITGNSATVNSNVGFGGGIYNNSGTLTLQSCTVSNNTNGGIQAQSGTTLNLTSCTVDNNTGNGISAGNLTLAGGEVSNNTGIGSLSTGGTVSDCTVNGNGEEGIAVSNGAVTNAIANGNGRTGIAANNVTISLCTVENNMVSGVSMFGTSSLTNSTIFGNSGTVARNGDVGEGGGVYCVGGSSGSPCIVKDCLIALNSASGDGGGIYVNGYATIANNTIGDNGTGVSGGAGGIAISSPSGVSIANNVIADNTSGIDCNATTGFTLSHNDLFGNTNFEYSGLSAGPGDIALDPLFVNHDNYDYHLSSGSPCINAGDDSYVMAGDTDLDGNARKQGTHVDIGCYETAQAAAHLTSLSPSTAHAGAAAFTLTVTGTGFVSGAVVHWNSTALTTTYVSATQVTASVPASLVATVGTASVTAVDPGAAASNALTFTITNAAATLTSLSPSTIQAGASAFTLTVNGTGFVSGAVVNWRGHMRTTTFVSSTKVTAAILASDVASAGTAGVTVTNPGASVSNSLTFTVTAPAATITSLMPSTIQAGSAMFTLIVNGANFTAGATVYWNGVALTSAYLISSVVVAEVPASDVATAGTAQVTVANAGQGMSNALPFTITPAPAPTVTSFTPTSGPIGTVVTVTGTNLNGVTAVRFHNANASVFSANAAGTQLTVTVPTGAGTGTFTVTTPGGSVKTTGTFTVN